MTPRDTLVLMGLYFVAAVLLSGWALIALFLVSAVVYFRIYT